MFSHILSERRLDTCATEHVQAQSVRRCQCFPMPFIGQFQEALGFGRQRFGAMLGLFAKGEDQAGGEMPIWRDEVGVGVQLDGRIGWARWLWTIASMRIGRVVWMRYSTNGGTAAVEGACTGEPGPESGGTKWR